MMVASANTIILPRHTPFLLMIRPLVVSIYDYRMAFLQEPTEPLRNGYKLHFLQASAFMAADEIYGKIDQQGVDPQDAIRQWNERSQELPPEGREGKADYKTRLDEIFKANNRTFYRSRDQERPISKEKSEDFRSPTKADFVPRYSSSSSFSHQRYHSPHGKEGYYGSRYKADRY